jgi:hypothetical protein
MPKVYKVTADSKTAWIENGWVNWLTENVGKGSATWTGPRKPSEKYQFTAKSFDKQIILYFEKAEDAVLFKLTWC